MGGGWWVGDALPSGSLRFSERWWGREPLPQTCEGEEGKRHQTRGTGTRPSRPRRHTPGGNAGSLERVTFALRPKRVRFPRRGGRTGG